MISRPDLPEAPDTVPLPELGACVDYDEPPRAPMTPAEAMWLGAVMLVSGIAVVAVILWAVS